MRHIEVGVLDEHDSPGGTMMFLARLTQRGHDIKSFDDLSAMYLDSLRHVNPETVRRVASMPHGTIKRFTPITIAIVGASRRFLAQARTHQVGMTFVSASLQYSDYSGSADYVVPYDLFRSESAKDAYLQSCADSMSVYEALVNEGFDHDAAGYAAPQGLRNILVVTANHEAWMHFIRLRACNRNTAETQYVALLIWEELLQTMDGGAMLNVCGPDCVTGKCREGKMSCGKPLFTEDPRRIIEERFPLLLEGE